MTHLERLARVAATALTGGTPSKPKLIDYRAVMAILTELRAIAAEPDVLNAAVDATGAGSDMSWSNRSPQSVFEAGIKACLSAIIGDEGK